MEIIGKFIPWSKRKGKEIEIPKPVQTQARFRSPEYYHVLLQKWDTEIDQINQLLRKGEAVIGRPWSFLYQRLSVLREMYSAFEESWVEYTNLIKYSKLIDLEREADLANQFNIPFKDLSQVPFYRQRQKNRIIKVHTQWSDIAKQFRVNAETTPLPECVGIDRYRAQCYDECLRDIQAVIDSL